jgi:hypothetical protein
MKRELSPIVVLVCLAFVLLTSGCHWNGHLYPVQGPLVAQTPVPVYKATLTGLLKGNLSIRLGAGDVCTGKWKRVPPPPTSSPDSMTAVWDEVYGPGYYSKQVLFWGPFATATVTCKSGNILTVEMYVLNIHTPSPVEDLGVARDSHGNLYKLVFGPYGATGAVW